MKHIKKIAALVLALAMLLSISVVAFADGSDNVWSGTDPVDPGTGLATDGIKGTTTIPLNKTIVIFNTDDNTQVREPDITFSYAINKVDASAAGGAQLEATVNDGTNEVNVYNGVPGAITNPGNIVYANTNTKVPATTKGYEDEKTTQIMVDPTAFPHAGIYRYVITETSSVAPESVGMEAHTSDYASTRYLDVYIYNPDFDAVTNPSGHQEKWMAAAVIFKTKVNASSSSSGSTTPGTDDITTTFEKTTGFEPGSNGTDTTGGTSTPTDYTNDATVDRYFTYNLDVTKKITGNLADKLHKFPFQIKITGVLTHEVTVDVNNNGTSSTKKVSTTDLEENATLADGETYSVTGLPKGTKVTVTEYNDTVDVYKLTTSFAGTTSIATKSGADEGITLATATGETDVLINSGATNVKADTKTVLTFTNDLAEISPTGYVVRIAPYVLMLAGGIALLVVTRRRREDAQAA